ncbi:hypothetical protein Pelo_1225 [Pelomyxa schiedti]|nr:hypothetical protein Pelo_1225 [Pelomyxa schiedti]
MSVYLRTDSDVMCMHNQYTMRLIVDTLWRQSSGISHTELSDHVLGGSWVKWGLNTEATCSKCNGKNGEPVEMSLWSLPDIATSFDVHSHSNEMIAFHLTPKCSSTRTHIKSKIVYLVTTIPGIGTFSSNPISLCSRPSNHHQPRLSIPRLMRPFVAASPPHLHPLTKTNSYLATPVAPVQREYTSALDLVSLNTMSNRQYIVDSRFVPKLPESTIAGIPGRIFRNRPAIFVSIMSIQEDNFVTLFKFMSEFQSSLEFTVQYGKISSNLFVLAAIHKSVENFYRRSEVRSECITGNNPFHVDFTQPNPILKFLGWANNTFSQSIF